MGVFSQNWKKDDFYSSALGETRTVTIVTPAFYEDKGDKKYPVVIILDGEYLLEPVNGLMSYANYWDDLPDVILVAVNQNKDNKREDDAEYDQETGYPFGRGAAFYNFIAQELLPHLDKSYNTAPYRAICGHNITAGFLNTFLYSDKPLFNAYISLSPKLNTNMENTIPEKLAVAKKPVFYYMATADGDVAEIRDKAKAFNGNMEAVSNTLVNYRYKEFPGTSHYALAAYALPEALYHIFSCYMPISSQEFETKIATLPSGHAKYLEDRYAQMEEILGYKVTVRLNDFKAVEAAILKNAAYEELKDLSSLARKNYPKTIISEYYTGLYYEMKGDKKRAIKTYVNSYSLNNIAEYTKDYMMQRAETIKSELKD